MYRCSGKIILVIWCLAFFIGRSAAQEMTRKKLAIYAPDKTFSLTLIEKQLLALQDERSVVLFHDREIVNINDLLSAYRNQVAATHAMEQLLMSQPYFIGGAEDTLLQEIGDNIRQYDQFLQINTSSFEGFIEYQFLLYPILKDKSGKRNRLLDVESKMFTTRIFNRDSRVLNLDQFINDALKDIFYKAHAVPRAKISVDKKHLNGSFKVDQHFIDAAVGDTVFLDAFYSIDKDTPKEFLEYKWQRLVPAGMPPDVDLRLIEQGINCLVVPNTEGTFKIELRVLDGVDRTESTEYGKSARDTITIVTHRKPELLIYPDVIRSYYVQNLTKDPVFTVPNERIILTSSAPVNSIETNTAELITVRDEVQPEEVIVAGPDKTLEAVRLSYRNQNTDKFLPVRARHPYGIASTAFIHLNHKVYFPYYFGVFWTQNEIKINSRLNLTEGVQEWNEPKVYFYVKVIRRLDIGLGWALKSRIWETAAGDQYKLKALGEIEASWKLISNKKASLGIDAFGKIFQVQEPGIAYTQLAGGLKAQVNVNLFQGLAELSLHLAILSKALNDDFIVDFTQWWGVGFKAYIPNH